MATTPAGTAGHLRVATYNIAFNENSAGSVIARLERGDQKARQLAAVIQRLRPDILLINEIDFDLQGRAAELFRRDYLNVGQFGQAAISYDYAFSAEVNTGVDSGLDLDGNGELGGPGDAWGFGRHPGQYGMLVLSRFPIDLEAARTFQHLRWADLPEARGPLAPGTDEPWYPPEVWSQLRLSSKSHWDLPIDTPHGRLHLLAAHPTPPAFDGPEKRNVTRNGDEIRLWTEYLDGAEWIRDDQGRAGGLAVDARFVIVGDLNADPDNGAGRREVIRALLEHPRVQSQPAPESGTDTGSSTANFGGSLGNLRVDYALPSTGWTVRASGVFWPAPGATGSDWIEASDHRLVWVDVSAKP